MKKSLFLIGAIAALSLTASADNVTLTTNDGVKHVGSVSHVDPDGITLVEDSGIEKVPFVSLPADVQKKYGFDAKKAAKFQQAEARADAHRQAQSNIDSADAKIRRQEEKESSDAAYAKRQAYIAAHPTRPIFSDPFGSGSLNISGHIFQNLGDEGGSLVTLNAPLTIKGSPHTLVFIKGVQGSDGDQVSENAAVAGTFSYTNGDGVTKTIPKLQEVQ